MCGLPFHGSPRSSLHPRRVTAAPFPPLLPGGSFCPRHPAPGKTSESCGQSVPELAPPCSDAPGPSWSPHPHYTRHWSQTHRRRPGEAWPASEQRCPLGKSAAPPLGGEHKAWRPPGSLGQTCPRPLVSLSPLPFRGRDHTPPSSGPVPGAGPQRTRRHTRAPPARSLDAPLPRPSAPVPPEGPSGSQMGGGAASRPSPALRLHQDCSPWPPPPPFPNL